MPTNKVMRGVQKVLQLHKNYSISVNLVTAEFNTFVALFPQTVHIKMNLSCLSFQPGSQALDSEHHKDEISDF